MKNHKKNKLGIYVYPNGVLDINDIYYTVNSISYDILGNLRKFRMIDENYYGIYTFKKKQINAQKK